ncbi:Phospholipase YtpA [Polystyrenella longa]|uniref:Phospholipase YtpA n=1 Tax=Polystyrenella longa TaxID=2528007 RepID=A0A518CR47_9PLAN|nr:alpha/beta fold hydrolase [Polystyrenella longa]QDU81697.1 Phospholipase YtpA [Polystyrenella longa]
MKIDIYPVESFDGTKLLVRHFHAVSELTRRTLLFTHGLSEHGGRYEHFGMHFALQGWNVIIHDLRGHGQSEGPRMHVDRFDNFCSDLHAIRQHFKLAPEHLTMIGHSLGGLITARDAQIHTQASQRMILLSPFLGMVRKPPVWKWYMGKLLYHLAPRTLFATEIKPTETTSNPAAAARRAYDPLSSESISAGLFFECQQALHDVWVKADRIQVPTLLYQAENDSLVNAESAMSWLSMINEMGRVPCEGKLFAGHKHELLNEADWEQTCNSIQSWIELPLDDPLKQVAPTQPTVS